MSLSFHHLNTTVTCLSFCKETLAIVSSVPAQGIRWPQSWQFSREEFRKQDPCAWMTRDTMRVPRHGDSRVGGQDGAQSLSGAQVSPEPAGTGRGPWLWVAAGSLSAEGVLGSFFPSKLPRGHASRLACWPTVFLSQQSHTLEAW